MVGAGEATTCPPRGAGRPKNRPRRRFSISSTHQQQHHRALRAEDRDVLGQAVVQDLGLQVVQADEDGVDPQGDDVDRVEGLACSAAPGSGRRRSGPRRPAGGRRSPPGRRPGPDRRVGQLPAVPGRALVGQQGLVGDAKPAEPDQEGQQGSWRATPPSRIFRGVNDVAVDRAGRPDSRGQRGPGSVAQPASTVAGVGLARRSSGRLRYSPPRPSARARKAPTGRRPLPARTVTANGSRGTNLAHRKREPAVGCTAPPWRARSPGRRVAGDSVRQPPIAARC